MERASSALRRLRERGAAFGERARGPGHHRQRRAQIVRDRGEQRVAQALPLHRETRGFRDLGEPRALEREARSGPRRCRADDSAPAAARGADCRAGRRAPRRPGAHPRAARTAPAPPAGYRSRARRAGRGRPPTGRPPDPRGGRRSPAPRRAGSAACRWHPGSRTTALHWNTSATWRTATRAMLSMPRVTGELAAHRIQQRRAALARAGDAGLLAHVRRQCGDHQRNRSAWRRR